MNRRTAFAIVGAAVLAFVAAGKTDGDRSADQEVLAPLQNYVGSWQGVGQVRRGSSQGAWIAQSDWAWQFADGGASLVFTSGKRKYFQSGELKSAGKQGFRLSATSADGSKVQYQGQVASGKLVLTAVNDFSDKLPARISIRLAAGGDRMIVLYERKSQASGRFLRLGEVGFTRQGSNFGKGTSSIECVVTGGKGTIPVTYEGKTYYVCCTGCRDLFNDDPEGVMADYRARKAEEKANKKASP